MNSPIITNAMADPAAKATLSIFFANTRLIIIAMKKAVENGLSKAIRVPIRTPAVIATKLADRMENSCSSYA